MSKPISGLLGPNDKYRELRGATVQFLDELVAVVWKERYKAVGGRDDGPVFVSAWYAKECVGLLEQFTPADSLFDLFDQLENACCSATNLIMLLRAMEKNG